jgi:glycine/D-amino acid oxidase-like deaminating enzyme
VVIVGAGIVGAATAYFLGRAGVTVRVLESASPASQATGAADGAVSVASKRAGPMMTAALAGIALYRELAAEGLFGDLFVPRSTFLIAMTEAEVEVLDRHAAVLAAAGVTVERIDRTRLHAVAPALSRSARAAVEVRDEGHAIGYQLVRRLLAASGAVVERHSPVEGLLRDPTTGAVRGVATARGDIAADAVVIAAGSGSAALVGLAGVLRPRKGQLLVTERAPDLNRALPGAIMSCRYLMSKGGDRSAGAGTDRGYGLVIDPLRTGQFLIGGTREDGDPRRDNDHEAVAHVLGDALQLLPGLADVRLLRAFVGVRTAVVDSLPLVGRVPGHDGLFVATGFEGDGICLGPITGREISRLVLGERPSIDLAAFDPGRFGDGRAAA